MHDQKWLENGFIDLRVPFENGSEVLSRKLTEYKNWIDSHQGSQMDFLKLNSERLPFFGESSVAQIKADIQNRLPADEGDPDFSARLFLQIAQEFDIQNDELNREFDLLAAAEQDLFKHIKGEVEVHTRQQPSSGTRPLVDEQFSDFMLQERLVAWCQLFLDRLNEKEPAENGLLITTSRSLMASLLEEAPSKQVLNLIALPQNIEDLQVREEWRNKINGLLNPLLYEPWEGASGQDICLPATDESTDRFNFSVYLIQGIKPRDYLAGVSGLENVLAQKKNGPAETLNTLIGLLSF
ncbi:hypothetical protein ACFLZL_00270 [Thermodesulfobacteriota bacterium]